MSLKQLIACVFFISGVNAIVISIAYNLNDNGMSYTFIQWSVRDHSALYLFMTGLDTIIAVIWCCVCHSNNKFDKRMDDITNGKV